jgi:hypothetical protein
VPRDAGAQRAALPGPSAVSTGQFVHADYARGRFQVDKRAFMDREVFERERAFIFDRCWLYPRSARPAIS